MWTLYFSAPRRPGMWFNCACLEGGCQGFPACGFMQLSASFTWERHSKEHRRVLNPAITHMLRFLLHCHFHHRTLSIASVFLRHLRPKSNWVKHLLNRQFPLAVSLWQYGVCFSRRLQRILTLSTFKLSRYRKVTRTRDIPCMDTVHVE